MTPHDFTDSLGTLYYERGSWCVWHPGTRELDPVLDQAAAWMRFYAWVRA